jgi:hypothetical protein
MINISSNGKFALVAGASPAWDWRPAHELLSRVVDAPLVEGVHRVRYRLTSGRVADNPAGGL